MPKRIEDDCHNFVLTLKRDYVVPICKFNTKPTPYPETRHPIFDNIFAHSRRNFSDSGLNVLLQGLNCLGIVGVHFALEQCQEALYHRISGAS